MLKILQARFQQYVNWELPDVQPVFRKGRATRDQIANIPLITEKAREFHEKKKNCFIDYAKSFHCGDHNKRCKLHRDGNTKPPYLPPEKRMQVKKQQNWTWNNGLVPNWERSMSRLYVVTVLNLYAEYIMRNAGLDESQAGIKIAGRNINNLR